MDDNSLRKAAILVNALDARSADALLEFAARYVAEDEEAIETVAPAKSMSALSTTTT